ncbi:MAG: sigma-70 family RNA polymerase sigma factor [Lachnospiraceae bacterium]|nr:sigma-70 family RNA polymerase sigma factor [Lachnospiraceae bacterium]
MKCISCGAQIPDDADFCTNCGERQEFNKTLIDGAMRGDTQAETKLYNATYNHVYALIRSMVKDEDTVLDLLQDSYVKAFRSLHQLQEANKFRPWLKTIAKNRTMDYFRERKQVQFSDMTPLDDEDASADFEDTNPDAMPDVVMDRQETARLLAEILDSLPDDQRGVISMFYYGQMSVKEIASSLGLNEKTVTSRLIYGRKKIKTQVLELEKRGTKLYGLAPIPFLLFLLRKNEAHAMADAAASASLTQILRQTGQTLQMSAQEAGREAAGQTAQNAAQGGTQAAGHTANASATAAAQGTAPASFATGSAAGAAAAAGGGLGAAKIAAIVIGAVAIVGGGTTAGILAYRNAQEERTQIAAADTSTSDGVLFGAADASQDTGVAAEDVMPGDEAAAEDENRYDGGEVDEERYASIPEYRQSVNEVRYEDFLTEYVAAIHAVEDIASPSQEQLQREYPNVNMEAVLNYEYWRRDVGVPDRLVIDCGWQYCFIDIDGNGTDEMLTASQYEFNPEIGTDYGPTSGVKDLYYQTEDGAKRADNLWDGDTCPYNRAIWVTENGDICTISHETMPFDNFNRKIFRLREDGSGAELLFHSVSHYMYDENWGYTHEILVNAPGMTVEQAEALEESRWQGLQNAEWHDLLSAEDAAVNASEYADAIAQYRAVLSEYAKYGGNNWERIDEWENQYPIVKVYDKSFLWDRYSYEQEFLYALYDINGDGRDEMLVMNHNTNDGEYLLTDVISIVNGRPENVLHGGGKFRIYLQEDGLLVFRAVGAMYDTVTAYRIGESGEAVTVFDCEESEGADGRRRETIHLDDGSLSEARKNELKNYADGWFSPPVPAHISPDEGTNGSLWKSLR